MVDLSLQNIADFDLDNWLEGVLFICTPFIRENIEEFFRRYLHLSPQGFFIKLHHSAQDIIPAQLCLTTTNVIHQLKTSTRLRKDIDAGATKLFFQPWREIDHLQEVRVYFVAGIPRWVRWKVENGRPEPPLDMFLNHYPLKPRCCMDVVIHRDKYSVIKYNPFDYNTNLYGMSYFDICMG